jgi:hypothetical protein
VSVLSDIADDPALIATHFGVMAEEAAKAGDEDAADLAQRMERHLRTIRPWEDDTVFLLLRLEHDLDQTLELSPRDHYGRSPKPGAPVAARIGFTIHSPDIERDSEQNLR